MRTIVIASMFVALAPVPSSAQTGGGSIKVGEGTAWVDCSQWEKRPDGTWYAAGEVRAPGMRLKDSSFNGGDIYNSVEKKCGVK